MSGMIRWGILSTARHAEIRVIPAMHNAPNSEVTAVASRDGDRAREFANRMNIPQSYGSYDELLADPAIDIVYIPLPNHLHAEWAIRAMRAGKHVLCEKPIGLNAAQAEEMAAVARDTGKILAEAFQWRHHPQAHLSKSILDDGALGNLRLIEAGFSFRLEDMSNIRMIAETGGGALYDVGCYPIALMRYMTGQEPIAATAQVKWNEAGIDENMVVTLEFPGDVLALFSCSFVQPFRRYFELVGEEGSLRVNRTYNYTGDLPGELVRYGTDHEVLERYDYPQDNSYTLMIRDVADALLNGTTPEFLVDDAIKNMRVIDACYRAARLGQRVEVAQ